MAENQVEEDRPEGPPGETGGGDGTEKYLIFMIQDGLYALPSRLIGEVTVFEKAFPLPLVPGYVRGIINRYSVPYALIDIGFLLVKNPSAGTKVIVLKEEVDKLAFLIDDVTDIADIAPGDLLKIEREESAGSAEPEGMGKLVGSSFEWKGRRVFCLETGELIGRIKRDFE
ncbi:MAG: chemotaxis protein CheW [Treponema sp.]|jgi:purine-binding chemotaxis protein CheW|nr:chemotaxis protein CheW [Treponema sp.]